MWPLRTTWLLLCLVHAPALTPRCGALACGSQDLYLKTPESCVSATAFVTWVCFELCCQLYYLRQWKEGMAILIHHVSAIAAWALYLQVS